MENEIISLNDWVTASGKYMDRLKSSELTQEVKDNAVVLINKVNALLKELGIKKASVSSGFRTSAANAAAGGSKRSNHMKGCAVDLADPDGKLDDLFAKNISVLEKHGLYLESPAHSPGWSHLQSVKTKNNPFIP